MNFLSDTCWDVRYDGIFHFTIFFCSPKDHVYWNEPLSTANAAQRAGVFKTDFLDFAQSAF